MVSEFWQLNSSSFTVRFAPPSMQSRALAVATAPDTVPRRQKKKGALSARQDPHLKLPAAGSAGCDMRSLRSAQDLRPTTLRPKTKEDEDRNDNLQCTEPRSCNE